MAKEKARFFTFLLYPDSVPADWVNRLELLDVPIAISPLHDLDKSGVDGQEYKKAHWHVIYVAKNPVTTDSVRVKIKRLLGSESVSHVQVVSTSMENMYLYLTHESKDAIAKNKHIYNKQDIIHLNNFDIDRYIVLDVEEKERVAKLVFWATREYQFKNIMDLYDYVRRYGSVHGFPDISVIDECLVGKVSLLKLYFDANYQRSKYDDQPK